MINRILSVFVFAALSSTVYGQSRSPLPTGSQYDVEVIKSEIMEIEEDEKEEEQENAVRNDDQQQDLNYSSITIPRSPVRMHSVNSTYTYNFD
ncbi:hypothetical protein O3Q51_12195 [Cryomorphaceae bacterium 1068]|nr:hypothetical protein [Cryomorphaceae bacterium 1068]